MCALLRLVESLRIESVIRGRFAKPGRCLPHAEPGATCLGAHCSWPAIKAVGLGVVAR